MAASVGKNLVGGWRGAAGRAAAGVRPLTSCGGTGRVKSGSGAGVHVWAFLAKGCREACWFPARLRRALLVPPFHEH